MLQVGSLVQNKIVIIIFQPQNLCQSLAPNLYPPARVCVGLIVDCVAGLARLSDIWTSAVCSRHNKLARSDLYKHRQPGAGGQWSGRCRSTWPARWSAWCRSIRGLLVTGVGKDQPTKQANNIIAWSFNRGQPLTVVNIHSRPRTHTVTTTILFFLFFKQKCWIYPWFKKKNLN